MKRTALLLAGSILLFVSTPAQPAARKTVQPVGLVVETKSAQLKRREDQSLQPLKTGEILFSGDSIVTAAGGEAQVVYCPSAIAFSLAAESEITFAARNYKVTKGNTTGETKLPICSLPEVFADNESGDDYGQSLVKTLRGDSGPVGTPASRLAALDPAARANVAAGVGPLNAALAKSGLDVLALLARGTLYKRSGLDYDAGLDFQQASQLLDMPPWMTPLLNTSAMRGAASLSAAPGVSGTTYAVVIGVSQFPNLPKANQLQYADADARDFSNYLRRPRGGGLKDDLQLKTLLNDAATVPAINNALVDFLIANATPRDTVILFMASHGVIESGTNKPYLLTSESDLQKLSSTAIPMDHLLELLDSTRSHAGRVLIFVDVCHASHIGDFRSRLDDDFQAKMGAGRPDIFAFAASRGNEQSVENIQYGGGHGAFSYFLLRGLNTQEPNSDPNSPAISLNELIHYVTNKVYDTTGNKQNPQEMGHLDRNMAIVPDVKLEGIKLLDYPTRAQVLLAGNRGFDAATPSDLVESFRRAVAERRLLPGEPGSAYDQLKDLRSQFGDDKRGYLAEENRLRVALENAGEQVLLAYLKGDEIPQSAIDFALGGKLFRAAAALTPEAHPLLANALFCEGRALIALHRYTEAMPLLEEAARIEPAEAYIRNALGIGYLQIPDYDRAVSAFQDAIRRAPFWAYPRHNLALALRERGNLAGAIDQYRAAIPLAPDYSYLRYNLGLLYQQINDRSNAVLMYREALQRASTNGPRARILVAEALLEAGQNHRDSALRILDEAATYRPEDDDLLVLRHDRALILAPDPRAHDEAEKLWLANLAQNPDYLPSLIALAEALDRWGETARAIESYSRVLTLRPDYVAARLRIAVLIGASDGQAALRILREGLRARPSEPLLLESMGDFSLKTGDKESAVLAWCSAYTSSASARGLKSEVRDRLKRMNIKADSGCRVAPPKR